MVENVKKRAALEELITKLMVDLEKVVESGLLPPLVEK